MVQDNHRHLFAANLFWRRGGFVEARAQERGSRCGLGGGPGRRRMLAGDLPAVAKPMWVYVFGHELTHALWTWLLGGRVKKFKASSQGGHVVVTKSNFLVALAPYFFPLYAMLVVLLFVSGHWLWNWRPYLVWFHLLLGAAYGFHVTLTWHILKSEQSDIADQGYFIFCRGDFFGEYARFADWASVFDGQNGYPYGAAAVGRIDGRRCSLARAIVVRAY